MPSADHPYHDEIEDQRPKPPDPSLRSWATDAPEECDNDNHASHCRCHLGEPILVDIPPVVGESIRQARVRERAEAERPTGHFARAVAEEAIALFTGDRNATYGDATDNFQDIGDLWAVVFGHPVSAEQVALCSALIKVARLKTSPDLPDNWTDATAYLALGGGINRRRHS